MGSDVSCPRKDCAGRTFAAVVVVQHFDGLLERFRAAIDRFEARGGRVE